jgi:hypothetical protein
VEQLETRLVPCSSGDDLLRLAAIELAAAQEEFQATLAAGALDSASIGASTQGIDANTTTSAFAGVGSLFVSSRGGAFLSSATPISPRHILTAAHSVDLNDDGRADSRDGIRGITFVLNYGGNQTHRLAVSSVTIHPDYTGFANPSVNDDIAVLTLASDLPVGIPIYGLPTSDLVVGTPLLLVGYGQAGDGASGYFGKVSTSVKRFGENVADAFFAQDDVGRPGANEVFRFDFDGPTGSGAFGGPTLGADRETTLGAGDSGGPSFVVTANGLILVGVNTFTQGEAPLFGSLAGGINVFSYVSFINSVINPQSPDETPQLTRNRERPPEPSEESAPNVTLLAGLSLPVDPVQLVALLTPRASAPALPAAVVQASGFAVSVVPPAARQVAAPRPLFAAPQTPSIAGFQAASWEFEVWLREGAPDFLDGIDFLPDPVELEAAKEQPKEPAAKEEVPQGVWLRAWEQVLDEPVAAAVLTTAESAPTAPAEIVPVQAVDPLAGAAALAVLASGLAPRAQRSEDREWRGRRVWRADP